MKRNPQMTCFPPPKLDSRGLHHQKQSIGCKSTQSWLGLTCSGPGAPSRRTKSQLDLELNGRTGGCWKARSEWTSLRFCSSLCPAGIWMEVTLKKLKDSISEMRDRPGPPSAARRRSSGVAHEKVKRTTEWHDAIILLCLQRALQLPVSHLVPIT